MHDLGHKDSLRAAVLAARSLISVDDWATQDRARARHLMAGLPDSAQTIALYVSRPGEPGTRAIIDELTALGRDVLLPVLRRDPDWARFTTWDQTQKSWGDIPEPTGSRLGSDALAQADIVVVACLAVGRDGSRLGTGGGWYDRALPLRRPGARVIALAQAHEITDQLPTEPHDIAVDGVVSETGWLDF